MTTLLHLLRSWKLQVNRCRWTFYGSICYAGEHQLYWFLYLLYREAKPGLMEEYGHIKLSYNTNQAKTWSENWLKTNKTAQNPNEHLLLLKLLNMRCLWGTVGIDVKSHNSLRTNSFQTTMISPGLAGIIITFSPLTDQWCKDHVSLLIHIQQHINSEQTSLQ